MLTVTLYVTVLGPGSHRGGGMDPTRPPHLRLPPLKRHLRGHHVPPPRDGGDHHHRRLHRMSGHLEEKPLLPHAGA